jgi:hypothetical protein
MYKGKYIKAIVFVLLMAGVLQGGIMAYSAVANMTVNRYAEAAAYTDVHNADASDVTVQEVQIPKKAIDISRIMLKTEVENIITSLDAANAAKNIKNYKTLVAALDVPQSFQTEIEEMYTKGHKVKDVLIAYEFLYQSYGSIEELEELITQKESGNAWNIIFKEYKNSMATFEPSNFEGGKLEEIFKTPGITPDDIIIADRTAQQTGIKFDELIAMRGQGMVWKTINEELEIINTSAELPRVAVTSAQVKNHMKETGLSEEQVIEALVLAQKLDKDGKAVVDKIKAGNTEEDIFAESLEEKYQ